MLAVLNVLFLSLHTGLIVFNVFGWLWPKIRIWNLATQLATLGSWIGMGAAKGWGYCLCTDLHWSIRREMGILDDPPTYVGFLIQKATGLLPNDSIIFYVTASVFSLSFLGSIVTNAIDWRRRKLAAARL